MSGKAKRARKKSPATTARATGNKRGQRVHFWTKLLNAMDELEVDMGDLQAQLTDKHPLFDLLIGSSSSSSNNETTTPSKSTTITPAVVPSYYFVFIPHALQSILPLQSVPDATAAVALAQRWTQLFCKHQTKWSAAATCRLLVGRSLMIITAACVQALSILLDSAPQQQQQDASVLLAAVVALDAATSQSGEGHGTDWCTGTLTSWLDYLQKQQQASSMDTNDTTTTTTPLAVPSQAVDWSPYDACLEKLIAGKGAITAVFLKLPKIPRMEARLALRRWAAVFLTWYGGQKVLMDVALAVLESKSLSFHGVERILPMETKKDSKKDSKKKDPKIVKAVSVPVPSEVTLLTLVCRLIHIVADAESGAGCRPPDQLESHMTQLLPEADSRTVERSNLRDIATNVVYHLLQRHAATLDSRWTDFSTTTSPRDIRSRKLVDGEYKLVATVPAHYHTLVSYYPYITNALQCLISCVGEPLRGLAAAWVLKGPHTDCHLSLFALQALRLGLELKTTRPPTLEQLDLTKPLVLPVGKAAAAGKSRKRKATGKSKQQQQPPSPLESLSATVSYAGLISLDGRDMTSDDSLAFFVRACGDDLVEILLQQLEACYNTNRGDVVMAAASSSAKRKADTGTPATGPKQKRQRKTTSQSSAATTAAISPVAATTATQDAVPPYQPLVGNRKELANKLLHVLFLMARHTGSSLSPLQSSMRKRMTLNHMHRIVDLSNILYKIKCVEGPIKEIIEKSHDQHSEWEAQMKLQESIFKGPILAPDGKSGDLFPSDLQKLILERIIAHHGGWPLWTNPAQERLISAGLRAMANTNTPSVDMLMVEGFIQQVARVLKSQDSVKAAFKELSADDTLVSLHDARFFAQAFFRIPAKKHKTLLRNLLEPMKQVFEWDQLIRDEFFCAEGVSSFYARLLTLAANVVGCSPYSRDARLALSNQSIIDCVLPSNEEWSEMKHFQSIFEPSNPAIPHFSSRASHKVDDTVATLLHNILQSTLGVGFKTASSDRCHLVFVAWNGLGQTPLWSEIGTGVTPITKSSDPTSMLIQLRDNVCVIQAKLDRQTGKNRTRTLVEGVFSASQRGFSIQSDVQNLIRNCDTIVNDLVEQYVTKDEEMTQDIPTPVFTVLEMCASALSFATSCMTYSENDTVAEMLSEFLRNPRPRTYSSDSDVATTEFVAPTPDTVMIDVVDRLLDISDVIGGAPCHPDWLDDSCHLREQFTFEVASSASHDAQRILTKLFLVAHHQLSVLQRRALRTLEPEKSDDELELFLNLCQLNEYETPLKSCCGDPFAEGGRDFASDVACVCGVSSSVVRAFLSDTKFEARISPSRLWCGPSGQRILGRFNSVLRERATRPPEAPELRVGGEWEVLLTASLAAAASPRIDANIGFSEQVTDMLVQCDRWDGVLFACWECLVPVSALRRFCSFRKGRATHPLRPIDVATEELEDLITDHVDDFSEEDEVAPMPGCVATLAALARIPCCPVLNSVAMNLMEDSRSFELLQGSEACSLSMRVLSSLPGCFGGSKKLIEAAKALLSRTLSVVEIHGSEIGRSLDMEPYDKPYKLLAGMGVTIPLLSLNLFGHDDLDPVTAFLKIDHDLTEQKGQESFRSKCVRSLFLLSCERKIGTDSTVHQFLTKVLSSVGLLALELQEEGATADRFDFFAPAVQELANMTYESLADLVEDKLCFTPKPANVVSTRAHHCKLLASLYTSQSMQSLTAKSEIIFFSLLKRYPTWKCYGDEAHGLFALTLLCASHSNKIIEFGSTIVEDVRKGSSEGEIVPYANMKSFIDFLVLLSGKSSADERHEKQLNNLHAHPKLPPKCTFCEKGEFREQHWYNCLSCGLVDDKGCCSLCAVTCHSGHSVKYSRFSPFFCDCGSPITEGEDSFETGDEMKCGCRTDGARTEFFRQATATWEYKKNHSGQSAPVVSGSLVLQESAAIARSFVGTNCGKVVSSFAEPDRMALWAHLLVDCSRELMDDHVKESKSSNTSNAISEMLLIRQNLLSRSPLVSTEVLTTPIYSPICSSVTGAVSTATLSTRDRILGAPRTMIDANERGLIVAVEKSTLSFFVAFPVVRKDNAKVPFNRSSLCPLSVDTNIGMQAVGVKFGPGFRTDKSSSVLIWSNKEAKVAFVKETFQSDMVVSLSLKIVNDGEGADSVIDCAWLSRELVLVGCRRSLQLFKLPQKDPILSVPHRLRHFAVVCPSDGSPWKLFLVSTEGRLRSCVIDHDEQHSVGGWEQHDDVLRKLCSLTPEDGDVDCRRVVFLSQSRLLLCQTRLHGCICLFLDESGGISGGFELLPQCLPKGFCDDDLITGPFSHWKELGLVRLKSEDYFCVCCAGSMGADGAKTSALLIILFNESVTYIQKVGGDIKSTVEGLASVSYPETVESAKEGCVDFVEKNSLFVIGGDGSVHVYRETGGAKTVPSVSPTIGDRGSDCHLWINPRYQVLVFEQLRNIPLKSSCLSMLGGAVSLSPENELTLVSPKAAGFTLFLSLDGEYPSTGDILEPSERSLQSNHLVIAAVRVLLGSTSTDRTPRFFKVMGRRVEVSCASKTWYHVIFDQYELALVARSGLVTVEFSGSNDSERPPVVDGIEVYATERHKIDSFLPFNVFSCSSNTDGVELAQVERRRRFELSFSALAEIKRLCPASKSTKSEKALVKQVIQETAFSDSIGSADMVELFLRVFEFDDSTRSLFHDKAVLMACSSFLERADLLLLDLRQTKAEPAAAFSIVPTMRSCLQTAAGIARARSSNYSQVLEDICGSNGSIASHASKIVTRHLLSGFALPGLIEDLVQLMLLENAVTIGSSGGRFGSLDGLCGLLRSPNTAVVEFVCKAVSCFCRGGRIFEEQSMALGYVCDSCMCAIEETRYSCDGGNFDLCSTCFQQGAIYINNPLKLDSDNVIIDGKQVGESPTLTCEEFRRMVETSTQDDTTVPNDPLHHRQLFNTFMGRLSHGISDLVAARILSLDVVPGPLILIAVDLFRHSVETGRDVEKAKHILKSLTRSLSIRMQEVLAWEAGASVAPLTLRSDSVMLVDGLAALVYPSRSQREYICRLRDDDVINTEDQSRDGPLLCLHGSPALLNAFETGRDAGKHFYGCPQKEICRFFRWTDNVKSTESVWFHDAERLGDFVWDSFSGIPTSFSDELCCLLDYVLDGIETHGSESHEAALGDVDIAQDAIESGLLCSLSRLTNEVLMESFSRRLHERNTSRCKGDQTFLMKFVENSLQFVVLTGSSDPIHFSKWLPILSRMVSSQQLQTASFARTRSLARQVLIKFCGSNGSKEALDYFCRVSSMEKLYSTAKDLFDYCTVINEKTSRSRESWDGQSKAFSQLTVTDMICVNLLVNEDVSSLQLNTKLSAVLSELATSVSKENNTGSWARFCGLSDLAHLIPSSYARSPPPLILLAVACTASPQNQTVALRLIREGMKPAPLVSAGEEGVEKITAFLYPNSSKTHCFQLSCEDWLSFVTRYVLEGHSSEIRGLGSAISMQLLADNDSILVDAVEGMIARPLVATGSRGKRSSDFFNLFQSVITIAEASNIQVQRIAKSIEACLSSQLLGIRHDRQNGEHVVLETKSGSSVQKRRFEFSSCASCRLHASRYKAKGEKGQSGGGNGNGNGNGNAADGAAVQDGSVVTTSKIRAPPEQITPQVRGKFGLTKENSSSSEFAVFFSLRYRIALYSVHLEIENARRSVKTIRVYSTPRPVQEAVTLKTPEYSIKWQLCGTFNLNRGCTRSSINLDTPVIAANIKIEYADFYDRPGVSKSSDGKIMSCPRCSGDVNVAHGVCSNCGEAAFQCRKCRHINYDRLDAFLCVECGYSASGSFQFDVTAGMATNAVAITNNEELDGAKKMLTLATRCYRDYKSAIRQKLNLISKSKKVRTSYEDSERGFSSAMIRRAFQGDGPTSVREDQYTDFSKIALDQVGKPGSVLKLVARPERQGDKSPLFNVSRNQPRAGNSSRRAESILIRGLGAEGEEESASELLSSLLESGGLSRYASSLDSGDPLSRLLASVSSRQARGSSEEQEEAGGTNSKKKAEKSSRTTSTKNTLEVAVRLYSLMMEAEREVFELDRRITAWENLEAGKLSVMTKESEFVPSHCSQCAPTVALQLLLSWLAVFQLDPNGVNITTDFVSMLLRDEGGQHLKETKRLVVKEIALNSKTGQDIVLEALKNRLILLQDVGSAEILRKILESVGADPKGDPFVALAKEVLAKGVDGHKYRLAF